MKTNRKISRSAKTQAAVAALWGHNSIEDRWQEKIDDVILHVARIGWSTVQLTNYFLCQVKRDWPTKMIDQGWLISKIIAVNGKAMTVLVLTYKAHLRAKVLENQLGRRIDKEVARQARHDLIAPWVSLWIVKNHPSFREKFFDLKLWSERVLKTIDRNASGWPDIAIEYKGDRIFHVEIERTRKTKAMEFFFFLKKLERYQNEEIETLVVFESRSQADKFHDQLKLAENFGVSAWKKNPYSEKYTESDYEDRQIFYLSLSIGVWDHGSKQISEVIHHNRR
jgi:hypothetical protein